MAQDFGGWTLTEGRNETMAMMAMMWCVISDLSAGDQDVSLTFETWTSGQPESWIGDAFVIQLSGFAMASPIQLSGFPHVQVLNAVGSVGAQQRWCFVDGCEFQRTNIFWLTAPLGQLSITLTCPDAGKKVAAKGELSDANTMGQIAAAKEKEVHLTSLQDISCKEIKCTSSTSRTRRRARCSNVVRRFGTAALRHLSGLSFTW